MAALRLLLALVFAITLISPVSAVELTTHDFSQWLLDMESEALAAQVSPQTIHLSLDGLTPDPRILEKDQKQPESKRSFSDYVHGVVNPSRIRAGGKKAEEQNNLLRSIASEYGVSPGIILALWGIESDYGRSPGDNEIIRSLATLAYDGRRGDFFRRELIEALHILDEEGWAPDALRGSWAGAMGQCQFMPSTYRRAAVDHHHNGHRDIWNNEEDVMASIANDLVQEGWQAGQRWGREVKLPATTTITEIGIDHMQPLSEWARIGVRRLDGSALPASEMNAALIQPEGPDGRSFLVYDNFKALLKWNHSTAFALSVGLLADQLDQTMDH